MEHVFVVPNAGWALLAKLLAGERLVITRVMVGSGRLTDEMDPAEMTDLLQPIAQATSSVPITDGNVCKFIVEYRNDLNGGLETGFWIGEYGVYAMDPDVGEILLYYVSLREAPQPALPYTQGNLDVHRFPVAIVLTDAVDVILNYPPAVFVTYEDTDEYFHTVALPIVTAETRLLIAQHNLDHESHPFILGQVSRNDSRITHLEDMLLNDVKGNPYMIVFDSLDGLVVSGVYNQDLQRIEF